jgi:hypothetical protein
VYVCVGRCACVIVHESYTHTRRCVSKHSVHDLFQFLHMILATDGSMTQIGTHITRHQMASGIAVYKKSTCDALS